MWKCPSCGEQLEEQFDTCWKCGTNRDGGRSDNFAPESSVEGEPDQTVEDEDTDVAPDKVLVEILHLQKKQQEALTDIQVKVGCLFVYMIAGIVLGILAMFASLAR